MAHTLRTDRADRRDQSPQTAGGRNDGHFFENVHHALPRWKCYSASGRTGRGLRFASVGSRLVCHWQTLTLRQDLGGGTSKPLPEEQAPLDSLRRLALLLEVSDCREPLRLPPPLVFSALSPYGHGGSARPDRSRRTAGSPASRKIPLPAPEPTGPSPGLP